jgi:hypothetical protein
VARQEGRRGKALPVVLQTAKPVAVGMPDRMHRARIGATSGCRVSELAGRLTKGIGAPPLGGSSSGAAEAAQWMSLRL